MSWAKFRSSLRDWRLKAAERSGPCSFIRSEAGFPIRATREGRVYGFLRGKLNPNPGSVYTICETALGMGARKITLWSNVTDGQRTQP
jgi:hypothetical protein